MAESRRRERARAISCFLAERRADVETSTVVTGLDKNQRRKELERVARQMFAGLSTQEQQEYVLKSRGDSDKIKQKRIRGDAADEQGFGSSDVEQSRRRKLESGDSQSSTGDVAADVTTFGSSEVSVASLSSHPSPSACAIEDLLWGSANIFRQLFGVTGGDALAQSLSIARAVFQELVGCSQPLEVKTAVCAGLGSKLVKHALEDSHKVDDRTVRLWSALAPGMEDAVRNLEPRVINMMWAANVWSDRTASS
jgi:hypothetical protein